VSRSERRTRNLAEKPFSLQPHPSKRNIRIEYGEHTAFIPIIHIAISTISALDSYPDIARLSMQVEAATTPGADWPGRYDHIDKILTRAGPFTDSDSFNPGTTTQDFLRTSCKILVIGSFFGDLT
jgi:hypothetical protein